MIRLLIAEDSTTIQRVLKQLLSGEPNIEIVGIASDGEEAVSMCRELRPDLVTMDIFMPKMSGLEATKAIMTECPTRIVIISSMVNAPDTDFAFEAMRAGAINVIEKPVGILSGKYQEIKTELLRIIQDSLDTRPDAQLSWLPSTGVTSPWNISPDRQLSQPPVEGTSVKASNVPLELICIGGSTGAPTVIVEILAQLPADYPIPIVVAQHISQGFAAKMAEWLNSSMNLNVTLADVASVPKPGTVLVCPDNRHLKFTARNTIALESPATKGGHIPSIDLLFNSAADTYGAAALGIILSGMGRDGADGLLNLRKKHAYTIAQNETTSVVYGMNRAAHEIGAVHMLRSPIGIAETLLKIAHTKRVADALS